MPNTLFLQLPKLPGACQVAASCFVGFTEAQVITTLGLTGQTFALATRVVVRAEVCRAWRQVPSTDGATARRSVETSWWCLVGEPQLPPHCVTCTAVPLTL